MKVKIIKQLSNGTVACEVVDLSKGYKNTSNKTVYAIPLIDTPVNLNNGSN